MIDGKGKSMFAKFDPLDRTYLTTDRINAETNTRYDQNSNLLAVTDGEGKATTYEYDVRDLKTKITHPDHINGSNFGDPNNGIELFEYDAISRTIRTTDQNGDTKTSNWDMANRLLSEDYRTLANSPSGTISDSNLYEYDDASRRTKATSGRYNNVCEFTFDEAGRPESESLTVNWTSSPTTFTTTQEYDTDNQLVKTTYPDGSIVERDYTARHQLETIKLDTNLVHTRTYDDSGRLATTVHGNGVTSTFAHRTDNMLTSINTPAAAGATQAVGNYGYDWDANKNKISETITGPLASRGFGTGSGAATVYDDEDRLTSWSRADGNLNRGWDLSLVGNWDSFTENAVTENRTHTPAHEIETIDAVAVEHDAKGNLSLAADGRAFAWDMDNKLVSATIPAGAPGIEGTHTYSYDALGRRVSKSVNDANAGGGAGVTTMTLFVCSGQQVILEYEVPTAGSPTVASPDRKFVFGSYIDEPILISRQSSVTPGTYLNFYYSRNQQYSITALTDSLGEVVERYAYTEHGELTLFDGAGTEISNTQFSNPYTYTARRSDPESGLMFFRTRYYHPQLGRFISRDPLGFVDGMSLYRGYFVPGGVDPTGNEIRLPKSSNEFGEEWPPKPRCDFNCEKMSITCRHFVSTDSTDCKDQESTNCALGCKCADTKAGVPGTGGSSCKELLEAARSTVLMLGNDQVTVGRFYCAQKCGGTDFGLTCSRLRKRGGKLILEIGICIPTTQGNKPVSKCDVEALIVHEMTHVRDFLALAAQHKDKDASGLGEEFRKIDIDAFERKAYTNQCSIYASQKCLTEDKSAEFIGGCVDRLIGNSILPVNRGKIGDACKKFNW